MKEVDLAPELSEFGWCPFARVIGEPCPLCGGTRAVASLIRGDLANALRYNASVVVIFGLLVLIVTSLVLGGRLLLRGRGLVVAIQGVPSRRVMMLEISVFAMWWAWNLGRW